MIYAVGLWKKDKVMSLLSQEERCIAIRDLEQTLSTNWWVASVTAENRSWTSVLQQVWRLEVRCHDNDPFIHASIYSSQLNGTREHISVVKTNQNVLSQEILRTGVNGVHWRHFSFTETLHVSQSRCNLFKFLYLLFSLEICTNIKSVHIIFSAYFWIKNSHIIKWIVPQLS